MNLSFLEFFEIGQSDSVESGYFLLFFPVASLNDPGNDEIPVFPPVNFVEIRVPKQYPSSFSSGRRCIDYRACFCRFFAAVGN